MTDLRTRIAKVLADHDPEGAALCDFHYDVADAVIRELQMHPSGCPRCFCNDCWRDGMPNG